MIDGGERPQLLDVRVGSSPDARAPVSVVERSLVARPIHWIGLLAVGLAAVAADQATKHVVTSELQLGEARHIFGPFWIHHVQNTGVAFGFFQGAVSVVTILTGIAVLWMVWYFARSGARHPVLPVALGFLIGGSLSNLVDRVRLKYVTDFIDPEHWPAFNLADVFITIGVGILLVALVLAENRPRTRRLSRHG